MNTREGFEKWVLSDYNLCGSDRAFLDKDISGEYVWPAIRIAWKIWQAAQPKWIKCSEPPEEECSVLLLDSNQVVWTGIYFPDDGGFQLDLGDDRDVTFTHYMLTPNLPEE